VTDIEDALAVIGRRKESNQKKSPPASVSHSAGRLIQTHTEDGASRYFTYDGKGLLTGQTIVDVCQTLTPTIVGTEGDDTITGTNGDDIIFGLGGNDTVDGGRGDDIICGGPG